MNTDENFCCEEVRSLSEGNSYFFPLARVSEFNGLGFIGYNFADRQIRYCPSCGKLLKKPTFTLPKADNPEFCCGTMESNANVPDEHAKFEIFYQPWTRRYFFSTATGDWRIVDPEGTIYKEWDFYYCLYCGKKLPESLLDLWIKTVEKGFGVKKQEPIEKMLPFVPEEFRTDCWWKKRGL